MTPFTHFYSRYGQALLYEESHADYKQRAQELLMLGLENFRLKANFFEGQSQTSYSYLKQKKGSPSNGIFLAPSVIISDLKASGLWGQTEGLIKKLDSSDFIDKTSIKQAFAPMTGEYNNGKSRHTPNSTIEEAICCAITTLSTYKPCISFRGVDGKYTNNCIIPDLPIKELQSFIALFRMMLSSSTSNTLLTGKVSKEEKKTATKYIPRRPEIFYGNFPNPPRSSYLATIGIIASIAEWAKEAEQATWANKVLESLKDATLYLVAYGEAKPFSYNHFIIDLAKESKLRQIIDSIFYTELIGKGRRNFASKENIVEYRKFDLFASRFLQLFNRPAFKDFLAFRAEYSYQLNTLFTTYFTKMEKIDQETVKSAKELGRWLNYVAYLAAKSDSDNKSSEDLKKAKAKALVELESSAFSAKTGDALVAQVITRAGRISLMDAPPESELFIEKTCSGDLPLEKAKNLLIAFSRLRNKIEKAKTPQNPKDDPEPEDTSEYNDA